MELLLFIPVKKNAAEVPIVVVHYLNNKIIDSNVCTRIMERTSQQETKQNYVNLCVVQQQNIAMTPRRNAQEESHQQQRNHIIIMYRLLCDTK